MVDASKLAPQRCGRCGMEFKTEVVSSVAGHYVLTHCRCGPLSRDSDYYATKDEADRQLAAGTYQRTDQ